MTQQLTNDTFEACPLCGAASESARNSALEYEALVPGAGVCGACAEGIANAFQKKHAGIWLTWPDYVPRKKCIKSLISADLKRRVHEHYFYRCVMCATHLDLTCDHIIPESKGGQTVFENLQTMCRSCNSKKGAKQ